MIFQFTIEQVLSGLKCQTSRLWQEKWGSLETLNGDIAIVYSKRGQNRRQYYVGQELAAQPARGAKGIARIRITELAKRDVRDFTEEDIAREGFDNRLEFYKVWYGMHFKSYVKLLGQELVTPEWWLDSMKAQIAKHNTALIIRFELVTEKAVA